MEKNSLSYDLMKSIEKIYHNEFHFDLFYQGEIKVLTFIASYKNDYKHEEILPSDISKCLNMTSPRVSSILNNLEKKGYIKREFSIVDRRKVNIYITDDGLNYVKNIALEAQKLFNSMIEKIGEDDAKELIRILNKISN